MCAARLARQGGPLRSSRLSEILIGCSAEILVSIPVDDSRNAQTYGDLFCYARTGAGNGSESALSGVKKELYSSGSRIGNRSGLLSHLATDGIADRSNLSAATSISMSRSSLGDDDCCFAGTLDLEEGSLLDRLNDFPMD